MTTMRLGPTVIAKAVRQALACPVLVLLVTVLAVIVTKDTGWFTVGGAAISALGARLWASRLLRLTPAGADDPLPATTHPPEPGAKAVQLNTAYFAEAHKRALDNYSGFVGVWLTIAGGFIGGALPFLIRLALL